MQNIAYTTVFGLFQNQRGSVDFQMALRGKEPFDCRVNSRAVAVFRHQFGEPSGCVLLRAITNDRKQRITKRKTFPKLRLHTFQFEFVQTRES